MKFKTLTYSAQSFEDSVLGSLETLSSYPQGAGSPARMSHVMAGFLLRLAAYLQGYLKTISRPDPLTGQELLIISPALDNTTEPLIRVSMNRRIRRRMRWLMRRGYTECSGERRLATADDHARCNLTPGQFIEYGIRVHGWSRVRAYGISRVRRRRPNMSLWGDVVCLTKALICNAPLSPD